MFRTDQTSRTLISRAATLSLPEPIRYNFRYTVAMKTAVSLPDDLFRKADATARRLKISRSQLYATAISEYLEKHDPAAITSRLNDIYSQHTARLDPALNNAQIDSLDKETW
jgi:hypothetical protein